MNEKSTKKLRKIIEALRGLESKCDYVNDELRISKAITLLENIID